LGELRRGVPNFVEFVIALSPGADTDGAWRNLRLSTGHVFACAKKGLDLRHSDDVVRE
jgi:hypothetical protein